MVWLTVPAAWDAKGSELMRQAAIDAGLVQSAHAGDTNWRERLHIITYAGYTFRTPFELIRTVNALIIGLTRGRIRIFTV